MEHWQFLIQKQGDRSWHVLESPNLEIFEGRYRVLARSNLPYTDVEVRVIHSSTEEVPPKRRIQKRSRRTNSEGLMAVIPFTHLKPGIWELRCSGDLMSDIFGKSWQYSFNLQVLSQQADVPVVRKLGLEESVESNSLDHSDSISNKNLISAAVATQLVTIQSNADTSNLPTEEQQEAVIDQPVSPVWSKTELVTVQSSTETTVPTDEQQEAIIDQPVSPVWSKTELVTIQSNADSSNLPTDDEQQEAVIDQPVSPVWSKTELVTIQSSIETTVLINEQQETVIDYPISPAWIKGETTEQILQNLIDLALPISEPLLEDEKAEDSFVIQSPPPLVLTLDQENYIARWGQALTINGRVELQEKTDLESPSYAESLHRLELRIELRSPLKSGILTQVRQPLPDQLLPLTINSSIDIPADCESKLILADINLWGALVDGAEVILLASQSFTITADVTELLAITALEKSSQPDLLDDSSGSPIVDAEEPETSISLDLELFNLVKTAKTNQSQFSDSLPNKPLTLPTNPAVLKPAGVRVSKLNKSGDSRSPQLPKLPTSEITKAKSLDSPLSAYITNSKVKNTEVTKSHLQSESVTNKHITPVAPINLEQLVIKPHRSHLLNTFPYLKPLKALADNPKVENNTLSSSDGLESQTTEDSPQIDTTVDEYVNTFELILSDGQSQDDTVPEVTVESLTLELIDDTKPEVALAPPTLELIDDTKPEVALAPPTLEVTPSPLIRKWMQSQGYSLPESIYLQRQGKATDVVEHQTPPDKQAAVDVNLLLNLNPETEMETDLNAVEAEEISLQGRADTSDYTETDSSSDEENQAKETAVLGESLVDGDSGLGDRIVEEAVIEEYTKQDTEEFSLPVSSSSLSMLPPPPPPAPHIKTPAWLAQEIVVDDTESEFQVDAPESYLTEEKEQPEEPISDLSGSLPLSAAIIEPLPIPQLHVPDSELIAGESVRVRVELPEISSQVAIKLWIEDCQTRGLLDGPHLLKDLLPNPSGGWEAMTQLKIPFGCLEIRLEAIALDMATQQESHKVTTVRTVIPPDLPNLQLDELLDMDL
ncbi:hypothetical protein I8748_04735 [Nostoc sp. CENA67]|uniref:Uncharacterized protein n=1 Tax=Amazonocrinis nigriterrae CENA67 TaxID=2794033 RepID=A0A8J7HS81_9NOST|nr:hypothetical protein [Amazonocrinis nigriterrae]MBH8561489.1 hypothetical protein [Amazonocrinis nigriterrae CENA67]